MEKFYITTPIYYVNDRPHIGHAYTTIAADTLARWNRTKGKEVAFLTGTDENSQKTVDAAKKLGEEIRPYTDRLADIWKSTWKTMGISTTDFIRTTEQRHIETVEEVWKRVEAAGDIYKGTYKGLYCKGHEAFMTESELVDGLCPDHKTKPEVISEENYFFRLSKYQTQLLDFYNATPDFVQPEKRFHEVRRFVEQGLEDISISREKTDWGIPVPNDPEQVIYVWFDALINYASAMGLPGWEKHPADAHFVGKDIARFHAVIWPAMLMSAKLPLPKHVVANGFFTINGDKISKSLGNAIDPIALIPKYSVDGIRYFLLREIPFGEDGDFSEAKLKERYNADLANGLGNFAARVLALGKKEKIKADIVLEPELQNALEETRTKVAKHIEEFKFHEALTSIWELIAVGDAYVNEKKPWEKKDGHQAVIVNLIVLLDNIAGLTSSFLPEASARITESIKWVGKDTIEIFEMGNLFPRIEK